MPHRGFLLQPTYRIENGRPIVHLFGVLESGGAFLIRDTRERPHFWVRATDHDRARGLGSGPLTDDGRRAITGEPVLRADVPTPVDTPPLSNRLVAAGVACFEADVRFAMRPLIDRGIRGSLLIGGAAFRNERGLLVFEDPEISPSDWSPALSVLSFDIETDPKAERLLSIALHGANASEVHLLTPGGFSAPSGARPHASERDLLVTFCQRVREIDPDVVTGWNIVNFDLRVLNRIAERVGVGLDLGRAPGGLRIRAGRSGPSAAQASIPGRVVLDGIDLVRGAFVKVEDHSLDTVAHAVLGVGKVISGRDRAGEILGAFHRDRERFVAYNLTDARLVLEILEKLRLVELAVERSQLTGLPPDRVAASIASFDFLYLSELSDRRIVAPSVESRPVVEPTGGGHVLEPVPGLHSNVLTFDFRSLYPSIIRTFRIDPLGFLGDHDSPRARAVSDPIIAPNGAAFRRGVGNDRGILPRILDDLFPRRAAAKARGDGIASQAIKILMNSFYGVLGTPACRFYEPAIANAITSFGRELLLWSKSELERMGHPVLYGDTDSLFVSAGEDDPERAKSLGATIVEHLNRELARHIHDRWGIESRLELELERLYLRLFLPRMRGALEGARKRYAGFVEPGEVIFTGMEVVRRDWTPLAKTVQRELYSRLFRDEPVDEFLHDTVRRLRAGELDGELIYRKALRKALDAYTSTTPPHVAAARKLRSRPGRIIDYSITTAGPEPAAEQQHPFDYEHYIERQIRPVAEPVLDVLGGNFDRLIGDESQLSLF